ncbi:D-glycero-beta-D-manno-heptose-1,7-bisphosphate 7-phosphatase [hydrothermal vent metagenome]|uniref:D,D-heptose 1,7-bisphosphate phosphatase n=1 Tax=hydrothermal vent metagenome TaxID=652676 RepID=A0A3B0T9T2_9ZZZZ
MPYLTKSAVILAGGKGTRLGAVSKRIPKPLNLVGSMPVLWHQLQCLEANGVCNIIIITNYLSRSIEQSVKRYPTQNSNTVISTYKESQTLGTAGSLSTLEPDLKEPFYLLYGDIMLDMDFKRMNSFHLDRNSDVSIIIHATDHPEDSDLVETDDNQQVVRIHSSINRSPNSYYPPNSNAGVYLFNPSIFSFLPHNTKADFCSDVFPNIINKLRVFGYISTEFIKDMGTPERLEAVRKDYLSGRVALKNLKNRQKAVFLDRDGVINRLNGYISKPEDLTLYPEAGPAIKTLNATSFLIIVVTNQPVIARGECTLETLKQIHWKMQKHLSDHDARIDALFFCPHHPHAGYPGEVKHYKIRCNCRKPETGMIDEAIWQFNIDPSRSFMIGDSQRDIECGRRAGLRTIWINRTNSDDHITSQFTVGSLAEAVVKIKTI